jgi:Domain of unknown function (DUF4349)
MIGLTRAAAAPRWLVFVALTAVLAAACASGSMSLSTVGESVPGPAGGGSTTDNKYIGGQPAEQPAPAATAGPSALDSVPSDLLVIKTGTLALQVGSIDDSLSAANAKIAALGGYVAGSQRSGDGESAVASITYRIPAARWDEALAALHGLAKKILNEDTQTQEVTGQVLDLGARITNLQATERALQAIMDRAVKISDVLDVQTQLTEVRGQIEQLETQKAHLEEQSAYGTLTVTFGLETVAVVEAQKGWDPGAEVDRATATLVQVGQALAAAAIWFGILWLPILLGLGVLAVVVLVVVRRVRRGRPHGTGPAAPGPIVPTAEA